MGIMAIGRIITLSVLVTQALSAPSGCIETCNFLETSIRKTSGSHQDHANLVQGRTHLNEHDYTRPGNWTEHNQYNIDDGHGKVHEERGQYVEGQKRVRYYKKNFTSSYGTGNVNGVNELGELSGQHSYDSIHVPTNQHIDSQSAYGLGQTVTKLTGYNRHNQQTQSLSTRIDSKSERLEDFGEHDGYSQVNQHVPSINTQTIDTQHRIETAPENWSTVDSYRTDGGRGHVFEEEGQYVTGPKKVRYHKKNYTSSYSSDIPQSSVDSTTLDELHSELQRNLQKDLDSIRRNLHQVSTGHTAATTHIGSTMGLTQEAVGYHDLQTAESDGYRQHSGYRAVPSTGSMHHYTEQQQRETLTDVRQQVPYTYPTASTNTYGTESHRTYQSHETHASQVHPVPQSSYLSSSYVQVPRDNYQTSYRNAHSSGHHLDETRHTELSSAHQSSVLQNQLLAENSQRVYNPHSSHVSYPNRHGETRHYEEHWRSSSHTGGSVAPERNILDHSGHGVGHTERAHYDRDAYNEHRGRYHAGQGYESRARTGGSSYDSAYRASSGQLVTGSLDLGHTAHGADCTEETHQQYQHETKYHRKYKRDAHHGDVQQHQAIDNEDFTQQNQEFGQESQQSEDLTQQTEQFTQQTQGSNDFTQQTSGNLELGQQTVDSQQLDDLTQQNEQFTQQTEGQLEFGQQTVSNPHLKDLTQQSEQFTQQTEGQLELGQQTVHNSHLEDLTQQSEQFSQQTEGQLEFGQQTVHNSHLEDLTQQTQESDDLTQQTSGKLEFGQQTEDTQQLEQFAQQTSRSDNLRQQTQLDKHEFGQQIVGNKHLNDLTQQSEQFSQQTEGQLEFGQQTVGSDDFTQQSVGELEFGQQTQSIDKSAKPRSQRMEEFNEQSEDFTQQMGGFNDFTQQTMGRLEFGQMQQQHRPSNPKVGNHHLEDLTQQSEDLTQQVGGFDDFSQQTAGHLEYGQQREPQQKPSWPVYNTQRLEHYPRQNEWDTDNPSQQSSQYPFYNNEQSEWQLEQMSQRTNSDRDFTQQTDQDHLATDVKPAPKPRPRPRYQKHDVILPRTDGTDTTIDNVFKPVEVNPEADIDNVRGRIIESGSRATYPGSNRHTSDLYPTQASSVFDNQKENMDRLHWVHKSNDATVGLQWHYTYHPSDLTNVEGSHDNYYPHRNVDSVSQQTEDVQQQSRPFDFKQQEAQDMDTRENRHQNSYVSQSSRHHEYDQQSESSQQVETSHFDNQFNQDSDQTVARVIPLQRNENARLTSEQEKRSTPTTEETEDKSESRILQAYGGGPYDASHNDDFYNRVRPNPSATLPPISGDDSWIIREKPRGTMIPRTWSTVSSTPEILTTTEVAETTTQIMETTTQPSFWSRVGHKITNTYDKAKEKAKEIFG